MPATLADIRRQISRHFGESFPLPSHADDAREAYAFMLAQHGMDDPDGFAD